MQTIERRVCALEQASPIAEGPIFIQLVPMGAPNSEIKRIAKGGQEWVRKPGESEQDLKNRARLEAPPPQPGCSTVFLCT